jgi:hypothetical protein
VTKLSAEVCFRVFRVCGCVKCGALKSKGTNTTGSSNAVFKDMDQIGRFVR